MRVSLKVKIPAWTLAPALAAAALAGGLFGTAWGEAGIAAAAIAALLVGLCALAAAAFFEARRTAAAPEPRTRKALSEDLIDPVTGLANLNGFTAWIAEKSARYAEKGVKVVILAADFANYGQLVRDRGVEKANAVLKEVAGRVDVLSGEDGIAARIEGEEFAAIASIVKGDPLEAARVEASKLAETLQRPVELPDGVIWIGASVGAAAVDPNHGLEIFARAKSALAKARSVGRGHFVVDGVDS